MKAIILIQELIKDLQLDKSRHRSQRQHTRTSSRNQGPPSSGCCSSSDTESSASSSEYSSDDKYSLSHSCYDDRVFLQLSAHHLIDVIIINMINVINININMKNICHLRGITIIKIGKFIK